MYRASRSSHRGRTGRSRFGSGAPSRPFSGGRGGFSRRKPKKILTFDPSHLVQKAVVRTPVPEYTPVHTFSDFNLHGQILRNIQEKGFISPTPIQDQAIEHILAGKDVVGTASTGTGKTGAFLIPLIQKVISNDTSRVLIMAPTRELAVQIKYELADFGRRLGIFSALCIGGSNMNRQIDELKKRPDFVIGTPGRLKDLYERGKLKFPEFDTVVLDEVDRMLDMGFIRDVRLMIQAMPRQRHSLFFSATIAGAVHEIMNTFLTNPVSVSVENRQPATNVNQDIIKTNGRPKIEILHELLLKDGFDKVLIFGRTKRGTEKLYRELDNRGFRVAAIHGNKSQNQRQRALRQFKENHIQVLLATDVVARGIDIDNITHVINFDLPETYEDYIHRIGRTGRADKTGTALTFV